MGMILSGVLRRDGEVAQPVLPRPPSSSDSNSGGRGPPSPGIEEFQKYFRSWKNRCCQAAEEELVMSNAVSYARWSLEPYCIGMKLRVLRTQKRLTLSRLAAETGLSTALLSKLETDRMIPTLPTLATICRVYGVGLSFFFAEPARHTLSITRKAHLQGTGRSPEAVSFTPLNSAAEASRLVAQTIEFPPGGASLATEGGRSSSSLVYVLEGRLQLDAGGTREVLETGDCAYMESEMALVWSAAEKHRCRILAVTPAPASVE
jgi:transcriptional regulator with XRE-family HTH domain